MIIKAKGEGRTWRLQSYKGRNLLSPCSITNVGGLAMCSRIADWVGLRIGELCRGIKPCDKIMSF
jgi:hypothetical protein